LLEHIFVLLLLLLYMMFDRLLEHRDLGIKKFICGACCDDLIDQQLGAVMLDIGFPQQIIVDLAIERGVENFFLDPGMNLELGANPVGDVALARAVGRPLKLGSSFSTAR
jgi:hypothetical protein